MQTIATSLTGPVAYAVGLIGIAIAGSVAFDLCAPPLAVVFRPSPMFGASVPKTTIDENRDLRSRKSNVDRSPASFDELAVQSEAQTSPVQL